LQFFYSDCKFSSEELAGAQNFNLLLNVFFFKKGFSVPNFTFLNKNCPARRKFPNKFPTAKNLGWAILPSKYPAMP